MKIAGSLSFQNQYHNTNKSVDASIDIPKSHSIDGNMQNVKENFPGEQQFIDVIEKSNKDLKINNTSLKFSIHEKTKQIMVKIVDNDTEEVIKEIPPEKILDMVAAMIERTGLFVDKKA